MFAAGTKWFQMLVRASRGCSSLTALRGEGQPLSGMAEAVAAAELEHDPRKFEPVFRKDHASSKTRERGPVQSERITLVPRRLAEATARSNQKSLGIAP